VLARHRVSQKVMLATLLSDPPGKVSNARLNGRFVLQYNYFFIVLYKFKRLFCIMTCSVNIVGNRMVQSLTLVGIVKLSVGNLDI